MNINLNDFVSVTLSQLGATILNQQNIRHGRTPEYSPGDTYKTQIWILMEVFGPFIGIGKQQPFDARMELETKE